MPLRSAPLNNYPVVRSRDANFVRSRLSSICGVADLDVSEGNTEFLVDANHLQIGGLGLSYLDIIGTVSFGFGEASLVRQIFNLEGFAHYAAGNQSGDLTPRSWTPVLHGHKQLGLDVQPSCRQFVLRIEFDTLLRNLGILVGQDIGRDLVFDETDARQPAMEALRRRIFQFAQDYNERGTFFSDLAAAEVERMVIMKFLMCHRHNYTHLLLREPLPTSSNSVRIVEEFIEANWDKPINIEKMVAITKISARSLFRQFRRDRGYSPADFAKRVRLNRAREMLEAPNETRSVIQVALRCGFQNAGHFARDYRNLFGELPSVTAQNAGKWLAKKSNNDEMRTLG